MSTDTLSRHLAEPRSPARVMRHGHAARGQALVEALVGGAVLATCAAIVILLAKYQSLSTAANAAARVAAFDCAAYPGYCAHAGAAGTAASIRSAYFEPATDHATGLSFWTTREGAPLLQSPADARVEVALEPFDGPLGVIGGMAGRVGGSALALASELAGPGRFGLDIRGGLTRTEVNVAVLADRQSSAESNLLEGLPLTLGARVAVLADHWNASGPSGDPLSVEARVDQGKRLPGLLEDAIGLAYAPTLLFMRAMDAAGLEPHADAFDRHALDVDLVPHDRVRR